MIRKSDTGFPSRQTRSVCADIKLKQKDRAGSNSRWFAVSRQGTARRIVADIEPEAAAQRALNQSTKLVTVLRGGVREMM
jgi:hypothetical protein